MVAVVGEGEGERCADAAGGAAGDEDCLHFWCFWCYFVVCDEVGFGELDQQTRPLAADYSYPNLDMSEAVFWPCTVLGAARTCGEALIWELVPNSRYEHQHELALQTLGCLFGAKEQL